MKHLLYYKIYETIYYRGITDKTKDSEYVWLTKKESHADLYSIINKGTYGDKLKSFLLILILKIQSS